MFKKLLPLPFLFSVFIAKNYAQPCTLPGMTPDKAIPVCGTSVFHQAQVTNCTGPDVARFGCPESVTSNKSFWYKFTCFQTGTLGFLIRGISNTDDYDWSLLDITGRNPTDVFSDPSLQVSLNLYGTAGNNPTAPFPNSPTGCVASGSGNVHCMGDDPANSPFNSMPVITAGHNYLLMVTNWTATSTTGYDLSFTGGSASITDPTDPHLAAARAPCDGTTSIVRFNKKMKCNSLSANGSEFTINPRLANVISATGFDCATGFDMDSVMLTFDSPLPAGNYTITIANGSDGNTLADNCDRLIPVSENIPMTVYPVFPTPMDNLSAVGCVPDRLELVFRKPMQCSSIAADGSDFIVTGTIPVTVTGATGVCNNGLSTTISVQLSAPIQVAGNFQIVLASGSDGNTIIDECGQQTPAGSSINFTTKDTVNADFSYTIRYGCEKDTVDYVHDGRNGVNVWKWNFDDLRKSTLQNPSIIYGTFGLKHTQLTVSNGVCTDATDMIPVLLDNELKADFEVTAVVCPGDLAQFINNSIGNIISWNWDFGDGTTSTLQQPPPKSYLPSARNRDVIVRLIVVNNHGCADTLYQTVKVANNCYIAVPNAFTPNGDGLNDYLYPLNAYKAVDLIFRVYNRFGQLLFETKDWTKKWDGTFKGQGMETATYVWILEYTHIDTGKRVQQKGTSILLR